MNLLVNKPLYRRLRGYALDPSYSFQTSSATVNLFVYKVPWEELQPGPVGEYVEVIDRDEEGNQVFSPIDLDDIYLLAQDGLAPSDKNFQFHQQMVYAVAMTTIKNFEKGLGRLIHWGQEVNGTNSYLRHHPLERINTRINQELPEDGYIRRLKIYPHGMKEVNAYFDPDKNALILGYFLSNPEHGTLQMPNSVIYTCLSHDIISHEMTHAIIHGLYGSYEEGPHPDTFAFHEAFADLVALFQHFSFSDLIKNQIAKTRGDLSSQNYLIEMASQFGTAIGNYRSLRDAIGNIDPKTKQWTKKIPSGKDYETITEPHERGQILVGIIFDSFITIYQNRIAELVRIATGGSGILQQGELHPDIVNRMADEASSTALHLLRMCIRALDYCPPTDIMFGDFLRAMITSDIDMVEEDKNGYRLAITEAFREWGVYPSEVLSLSEDSVGYPLMENELIVKNLLKDLTAFLREYSREIVITSTRKEIYKITQKFIDGDPENDFKGLYERIIRNKRLTDSIEFARLTGLVFNENGSLLGIENCKKFGKICPLFEIKSLHMTSRVTNEGKKSNQIIISIIQRAKFKVRTSKTNKETVNILPHDTKLKQDPIELVGGCTLIFDLESLALKYAISKPLMDIEALKNGKYQINTTRALSYYNGMIREEKGL